MTRQRIERKTPLKRYTPVRKKRSTLRRGEPTAQEKENARIVCYARAKGMCQIPFPHECPGYVPLTGDEWHRGQLAHFKAKRRFGWQEDDATGQKHLWSCPEGHKLQHAYGHTGVKPCPKK